MAINEFSWKIKAIDIATMEVEFFHTDSGHITLLNISRPLVGSSISDHIAKFAPIHTWTACLEKYEPVKKGQEGIGTSAITSQVNEVPNIAGSFNDEYLRAMIFQVLEELKEAEA